MGLFSSFGWLFGILPVLFLLPLLFPDGRLPSSRWKPFLWFIFATLTVMFVGLAFGEPMLSGSNEATKIPNPLHVGTLDGFRIPDAVFGIIYFGIFATSVGSLFMRSGGRTGPNASRSSGSRSASWQASSQPCSAIPSTTPS